jgi:septal ring factor EnvC (AmiA/AmiB activator)
MRELHVREAAAHAYIQKLKNDLDRTTETLEQSRVTLTHCEAALVASWEQVQQERLGHVRCREELILELAFERERHKETTQLLDRVFKEATRSGEIADRLGERVAALEATERNSQTPRAMELLPNTSPNKNLQVHATATPNEKLKRTRFPGILQPGYQGGHPTPPGAA